MNQLWLFFNIAIFAAEVVLFVAKPYSIWNFFRFCYVLVIGMGIIFVVLMDQTVGYKFRLYDVDKLELYFLLGYLVCLVGYGVTTFFLRYFKESGRSLNVADHLSQPMLESSRYGLNFLMALSVFASLAYLARTGISFGKGSYQDRYSDAEGAGAFLLLIPAFLPWAAMKIDNCRSWKSYFLTSAAIVTYSAFTFVMLHGYRQLLIATALLVIVIGVKNKFVNRSTLILGIFGFPAIIVALSFIRYASEQNSAFGDQFLASLYYIQGDVFPVDAPLRTYWFCSSGSNPCPGFHVFLDHLTKFLPRALFPEKPLIAIDAAGFFTQNIVGYDRKLTLSSTILSEAFMMKSFAGFCAIFISSGFLCAVIEGFFKYRRRNGVLYYILLSNIYMCFFWVREGLEEIVNRSVIVFIFVIFAYVMGKAYLGLFGNVSLKRR